MATPIPDFGALAQQQGQLNQQAADSQTLANRANQTNPYGSLTWSRNPDGSWVQNISLNPQYQAVNNGLAADQSQRLSAAGGFTSALSPVTAAGLQPWAVMDPTAAGQFGAEQKVIDAYKQLQQPGLDQARDQERARLAAMGITLGSEASNNSERLLSSNQQYADARAILAGTQEYGNVFNRQLQATNQVNALRGQQLQERIGTNASNLATANGLTSGITAYDPKFASYATAASAGAPNIYGAATDTFNANIANENAEAARTAANRQTAVNGIGLGLSALPSMGGLLGAGASALASWFGSSSNTDPYGIDALGSMNDWWGTSPGGI